MVGPAPPALVHKTNLCKTTKNDDICASENRINVLLDLLCEEKEKCGRFNERNIILKRETNDLQNKIDSLTEIIRMLFTENYESESPPPPPPPPSESPTGIVTRNKFPALKTENREEKNSTITDDNSLFFIQMENVKMKRKLCYLENKVKEKQSRGCGENDQEQYEQSSTNKEIVKGKKYPSNFYIEA